MHAKFFCISYLAFDNYIAVKSLVKLLLYSHEEDKSYFQAKACIIPRVKALEKQHQENLKSSVEVMGICSPVKCIISFGIDYNLLCFLEVGLRQWDPFLVNTAVAIQFHFPFSLRDCAEQPKTVF